ncbi:hypothetical protein ABDI30_17965 [Paenibacillus cisolokensis]|uniref:hypothetical protein n=1 Tax=Paenibacillus cisolokensis TaxID=1658519 RepID=UPI003D2C9087
MERNYTFETIARSLGTTPEQIKRLETVSGLETFTPGNDRTYSKYPKRIKESEVLRFFKCETMDDFRKLKW